MTRNRDNGDGDRCPDWHRPVILDLADQVATLRRLVLSLADRVAAAHEVLQNLAEKREGKQ